MRTRLYHLLLTSPVLFIWIWTWLYLGSEWSVNEQYRFGFAVPPLALYLAWQNWPASLTAGAKSWVGIYLLAWPVLLLAEMLRLVDPLWRLTGGLWMMGATLLTVGYLIQLGGWVLVRRMIFPLCFLWVGLPWPMPLENQIIQTLTRVIAAATATLMNLAGVAALQRGNTIELANQVVGIDAACTGIESFQASLMVSLFLWGLMRLRWRAGLTLVVIGTACSLFINLCRVLVLTWSAHSFGSENQSVHDWVGAVATVLIFGMIFFAAKWLHRKGPQSTFRSPGQISSPTAIRNFTRWSGATASGILFLSIPLVAGMARGWPGQPPLPDQPRWQLNTSHLPEGWSIHALDPTNAEKSMLRFSKWTAFQIRTSDGLWANVVHLFWDRNRGMPSMAFYHTPALCMPSAGWQASGEPRMIEFERNGKQVAFVSYSLMRDQDHVFALQYLVRGERNDPFMIESARGRLDRISQLWHHSTEPVREEILIYLPYTGSDDSSAKFAETVFSSVAQPVL
jgi:exosortase